MPGGGSGRVIRFGKFDLDCVEGSLRRDGAEVSLRAKSFAVLRYFAQNPGRLITREELLHAVWQRAHVSPSVVRVSIGEVREALGDDSAESRFIETVGRQGYRFVAAHAAPQMATSSFVGRAADLRRLHTLLRRCRAGSRQFAFVTGEPGIGKTALVQQFLREVRQTNVARIAQGQCVDLQGSAEPYLPVLDMLGASTRERIDEEMIATLNRWAPSWLLQMSGVV